MEDPYSRQSDFIGDTTVNQDEVTLNPEFESPWVVERHEVDKIEIGDTTQSSDPDETAK